MRQTGDPTVGAVAFTAGLLAWPHCRCHCRSKG
jgi:hypothetical protein